MYVRPFFKKSYQFKNMKKIIFLLGMLLASTAFNVTLAENKKDKKKKQAEEAPLKLESAADSISYAAGMTATQGLIPFIQQQYGVDTTYMADFITGFKEALSQAKDPRFKAYNAGAQIAEMAAGRIFPGMKTAFDGTPDSLSADIFYRGFEAALHGDYHVYAQTEAQQFFEKRQQQITNAKNEAYKKQNDEWLAQNKTKPGVQTTASGLQYKVITNGTGEKPKAGDKVTVRYEGKMIDGTVFDSSYKRKPDTSTFGIDQVIKGWTEGLQLMPVGSKWELYIPQNLAYGERNAGEIKPFSTLIFTVELVSIEHPATPAKK